MCCFFSIALYSQSDISINGLWLTGNKQLKVLIENESATTYHGKVAWVSNDYNGQLRVGDYILTGLEKTGGEMCFGNGEMKGNGMSVDAEMKMMNENTLKVIMRKLFLSQTVFWTKIEDESK